MVSFKCSLVLCARKAHGCHSRAIRSVLQKPFRTHSSCHWASHSFLVVHSRSSKPCDCAGRCPRAVLYWHFLHSVWGLSAFRHAMNNLLMAQGLVQDIRLCLENDVREIKGGRARRILKTVLGSVQQLLLRQPCCCHWCGDFSLTSLSCACLLQ